MKQLTFLTIICAAAIVMCCNVAASVADAEGHLQAVGQQCQRLQLALGPVYTSGTATYTLPEDVLRFLACDRKTRENALRRYEAVVDYKIDRGLLVRVIRALTSHGAYTVIELPDAGETRLRVFQFRVTGEKSDNP